MTPPTSPKPTNRSLLAAATLAAAGLAVSGCAGPLNQESGIGNAGRVYAHSIYTPSTITQAGIPLPEDGFEPTTDQKNAPVYGAKGPTAAAEAKPALVTIGRENWSSTPMDVPNDLTAHQPLFTKNFIITKTDPRAQGKYPNERTAMDVATSRHTDQQALEAVAGPFVVVGDMVLLPIRAAMELRPMRPTRTGSDPYVRWPGQVVLVNPPLEPQGEPTPILAPLPPPSPPAKATGSGVRQAPSGDAAIPQTPATELRPGGGMPATDTPQPVQTPAKP